jgi:hypothetical protein
MQGPCLTVGVTVVKVNALLAHIVHDCKVID